MKTSRNAKKTHILIPIFALLVIVTSALACKPTPTPGPTPPPVTLVKPLGATELPEFLVIQTDPPGATVEVGIQGVNGIATSGTGRIVGVTPIKVGVLPSDVSVTNDVASIMVQVTMNGYIPHMNIEGLGTYAGIYWTKPGWTITIQNTLSRP